MTTLVKLTLKQLELDAQNQRRVFDEKALEGLAQSIASQGLIVPLVVRASSGNKFSVIDGKRRFLALQMLAKQKKITGDHEVFCILREDLNLQDTAAGAISLAANVVREPMNPADEVRAFVELRDKGKKTPADIAAAFGISHQRVRQRLALGELSPRVLGALRDGKIDPELAAAFTATGDHDLQDKVLGSILKQTWGRNPDAVRNQLREGAISASSQLGQFVGREAYENAGGKVRHDLFDNAVTFDDRALVHRLAVEKWKAKADELKAAGWSWVAFLGEEGVPSDASYQWPRIYPGAVSYTKEQKKRLAELEKKDELSEEEDDEVEAIQAAAQAARFTEAQRKKSGVLIDPERASLVYGVQKPSDKKAEVKAANKKQGKVGANAPVSNTLLDDLAACMCGGVQMAVAEDPELAEAVLIATLLPEASEVSDKAFVHFRHDGPLSISGSTFRSEVDGNEGHKAFQKSAETLLQKAPKGFPKIVEWVRQKKPAERKQLLAHVVAAFVVSERGMQSNYSAAKEGVPALIKLANPDMRKWWKPTKHDMMARFSREQLIGFMKEIAPKSKDDWSKAKKAELVKAVAKAAEAAQWLPKELRTDAYKTK